MDQGAILLLAVGLAMDATAAAAARALAAPRLELRDVALVAVLFGGFQALMPWLGWLLGNTLGPGVRAWDHWVAFVLLAGIGGRMLWESRAGSGPGMPSGGDAFALRVLLLLAIATSVDAFVVGITLPLLGAPLVPSLVTIGLTTAVSSVFGLLAGRYVGSIAGRGFDALGGAVLLGLGVKILVEHLRAA